MRGGRVLPALLAVSPVCVSLDPPGHGTCVRTEVVLDGSPCDALPYASKHSSSNKSRAETPLVLLDALLLTNRATKQCRQVVKLAYCATQVPGCTSKGEALLPCASVCSRVAEECDVVLSSMGSDDRKMYDCLSWPSLYVDSPEPFSNCNAFEDLQPCMKPEQVFGGDSNNTPAIIEGAGSWCPSRGPRVNTTEDPTQVNMIAAVSTWEPVPFESGLSMVLVLVMWPASVVLSVGLGAVANHAQKRGAKVREAAKGDRSSIRFCTQVTLIVLVWAASALMFFLAHWTADKNIRSSFANANEAQTHLFESAEKNNALLTGQLFNAVGASFVRQVSAYFQAFTLAHNSTMHFQDVMKLHPRDDSAVLYAHMLSTTESSPLMAEMTLSLTISWVTDPNTVVQYDPLGRNGSAPRCDADQERCRWLCNEGGDYMCIWDLAPDEWGVLTNNTVCAPRTFAKKSTGPLVDIALMQAGEPAGDYGCLAIVLAPEEPTKGPTRREVTVVTSDGYLIPSTTCVGLLGTVFKCGDVSTNLFSVGPPGEPYFTGMWVYFGYLMMDLHQTVFMQDDVVSNWYPDFPRADISRGLALAEVGLILKRLIQFNEQRMLLIDNTTLGMVVALSHGDAFLNDKPIPVRNTTDPISGSLMEAYAANYTEVYCNRTRRPLDSCFSSAVEGPWPALPLAVVQVYNDVRLTPYYCMVLPLIYLNFKGLALNMIPLFEVEEQVLQTTRSLHTELDTNFTQVNESFKQGNRFMVIVSIGIIFGAALIAYLMAATIAKPLTDILRDMRDVANFRVELVAKRYTTGQHREGRRSAFTEINAMQSYFFTMVKQLIELKKFMPDTALDDDGAGSSISGRTGSSDRSHDQSSVDGSDVGSDHEQHVNKAIHVSVNYVHADDAVLKKAPPEELKQSLISQKVKRTGAFVYNFEDGKVSYPDLLGQIRDSIGLMVAEPIETTAQVTISHEEDDEGDGQPAVEAVAVKDSRQLAHVVEVCGDKLVLYVKKLRKVNPVPVLSSLWSIVAKSTKVLFLIHMFADPSDMIRNIGIIFAVVLFAGMALNCIICFRFNRQAMQRFRAMEEWLSHYVKEATCGIVVGTFDVQNLELVYCGLYVGRMLRFHAPMPLALRHKIVRLSMISLVTGQLVPLLIHFWFMDESGHWDDMFALASLAGTIVMILLSGMKKCVVFCLVDSSTGPTGTTFKVKEKKVTLRSKNVTVMRASIVDFSSVAALEMSAPDLTEVCNAFYEKAMQVVKKFRGSVTLFEAGRIEAVFNAPQSLQMHDIFACKSAAFLTSWQLPSTVKWDSQSLGPFRVVAGVVTGNMLIGNLGSAKRKSFHYIGRACDMLPGLLQLAEQLGVRVMLSNQAADRIKERDLEEASEWVLRPAEVIIPPGESNPSTVHELIPTHDLPDEKARARKANCYNEYSMAFDVLELGDFHGAASSLREYLATVGRGDPVALNLDARIAAVMRECRHPTVRDFARPCGHLVGRAGSAPAWGGFGAENGGRRGSPVNRGGSLDDISLFSPEPLSGSGDRMWDLPAELDGLEMKPEIVRMFMARRENGAAVSDIGHPSDAPDGAPDVSYQSLSGMVAGLQLPTVEESFNSCPETPQQLQLQSMRRATQGQVFSPPVPLTQQRRPSSSQLQPAPSSPPADQRRMSTFQSNAERRRSKALNSSVFTAAAAVEEPESPRMSVSRKRYNIRRALELSHSAPHRPSVAPADSSWRQDSAEFPRAESFQEDVHPRRVARSPLGPQSPPVGRGHREPPRFASSIGHLGQSLTTRSRTRSGRGQGLRFPVTPVGQQLAPPDGAIGRRQMSLTPGGGYMPPSRADSFADPSRTYSASGRSGGVTAF
eukprot:TRINITY_DN55355_c0_g1_i1.p1 TRINITY_DN55355_c0_g1~~TRINITY_DN55355_c0_g1_i1.p1  ORF type:complete len:1870 (+),score=525.43 TRINITY_DN55355_c0_g1_i1:81-5612(+)